MSSDFSDLSPASGRFRRGAYLPHWTKSGATYAVTFRLADSLPRPVLEGYLRERDAIVARALDQGRELTSHELDRLRALHGERIEAYLDAGAGACHLRRAELASVVAGALRHFEAERYTLHAWCVMPNHVHVVLTPAPGHELAGILHTWKSFTAHVASLRYGIPGPLWQPESYDHLVRDEADFAHAVHYVQGNPVKAGLRDWQWVFPSPAGPSRP